METVQDPGDLETEPRRLRLFIGQLSWRMILVRLLVNGLTLIAIALLVPNIYFIDKRIVVVLVMALALGLLNAFVKPLIQFVTLPFVFATYGFAIVLINTVLLMLLALIFEERFFVGSLAAAIVGGLVMGIFASFLESLLGLNLPIVPEAQGAGSLSAAVPRRTITDVLVDEMAGDEAEQPAFSEDFSEPPQAEDPGEPSKTVVVDAGENDSAPMDDEEISGAAEQEKVEPSDDADDERIGDER